MDEPKRDEGPASGTTPVEGADEAAPGGSGARIVVWTKGRLVEVPDGPALRAAFEADEAARAWIDLVRPTPAELASIASVLELHPLIVEDIEGVNQRARLQEFDGVIHIVLFALEFAGEALTTEIDIVLGDRFLLTAHDPSWDPLTAPMLRRGAATPLGRGPDYLLYALTDAIVDGYFPVLDHLAEEIDQLQDDVVQRASSWTLERLFVLKRELIDLRRVISPAREVFNQLTNRDLGIVARPHVVYFRDIYDHLIRVTDELDNYRELVAGTLDVYLSTVNNNLSVIMKRLTGVTVILAGVGAVAGVFGMSEAGTAFAGSEAFGFWLVAAATAILAALAAIILRRIGWI